MAIDTKYFYRAYDYKYSLIEPMIEQLTYFLLHCETSDFPEIKEEFDTMMGNFNKFLPDDEAVEDFEENNWKFKLRIEVQDEN